MIMALVFVFIISLGVASAAEDVDVVNARAAEPQRLANLLLRLAGCAVVQHAQGKCDAEG